jgi:ABC-2 type transport system permease protein
VRAVTFVVPLAFVNYYPVLYVLGKPAPLGLPGWTGLLAPLVAAAMAGLGALAWRSGIRRYRSTGS